MSKELFFLLFCDDTSAYQYMCVICPYCCHHDSHADDLAKLLGVCHVIYYMAVSFSAVRRMCDVKRTDWPIESGVSTSILNITRALGKKSSPFVIKDHGSKLLFHCNFSIDDLPSCLPSFYIECFAVCMVQIVKPFLTSEQLLNQILWKNQSLRNDGKTIFCCKPFSKGITTLSNILMSNGNLKP